MPTTNYTEYRSPTISCNWTENMLVRLAARQQCDSLQRNETIDCRTSATARFFDIFFFFVRFYHICCRSFERWPHDKESILWQIACDLILIHAQFFSYWIISMRILRHSLNAQKPGPKPFFDLYMYFIFILSENFLLLLFALPVAWLAIREQSNFTGCDSKLLRYSFHSHTWAAPMLTSTIAATARLSSRSKWIAIKLGIKSESKRFVCLWSFWIRWQFVCQLNLFSRAHH